VLASRALEFEVVPMTTTATLVAFLRGVAPCATLLEPFGGARPIDHVE